MEETSITKAKQKEQNLIALAIVLGGLFVGSLFVDFVQLFTGSGFSQHVIKNTSVLETNGRTWVAYDEPKVTLEVVNDKECLTCNTKEAVTWIKRLVPTASIVTVDTTSDAGAKHIKEFDIRSLPAFVFDEKIKETSFYQETKDLFTPSEKHFAFAMSKIGFTGGKFLNPPTPEANDITLGNPDAPVKIVVYTDFECQYCHDFHLHLKEVIKEYGDQVSVTYRHLPLSFHKQAPLAALASQCAHAQNKFPEYGDRLFAEQGTWGKTTGTTWFTNEARTLGLHTKDFNTCMTEKKYAEKIANDTFSAQEFGITGAPSTFVNTTLLSGAVDYDTLKRVIEQSLQK
ncbi:MAG: DsbA family protein [Candidatus Moranbacteria bacterium]|nr:DsbA family protein [Candidatus Moranbacteria bacterium]